MAKSVENTFQNFSGVFPNATAVNSSGAGATDGTEFVKAYLDNWDFGPQQALLSRAGLTPDEITESASASQMIEATHKAYNVGPGFGVQSFLNGSFASKGYRAIELNGQGVLRATYTDLDAASYVGDATNTAVKNAGGGFYRANDAAGTSPSITGAYLILPETRGYTPRGLDTAASTDPDGASRFLGDNQGDTFQGWQLGADSDLSGARDYFGRMETRDRVQLTTTNSNYSYPTFNIGWQGNANMLKAMDDGSGTPRTGLETRMSNFSVNYGVGY